MVSFKQIVRNGKFKVQLLTKIFTTLIYILNGKKGTVKIVSNGPPYKAQNFVLSRRERP